MGTMPPMGTMSPMSGGGTMHSGGGGMHGSGIMHNGGDGMHGGGMSGGGMAGMSMSFNSRNLGTVLLFSAWIPETPTEFALSCITITLIGASSVAVAKLTQRLEWWMAQRCWPVYQRNAVRGVTTFVNTTLVSAQGPNISDFWCLLPVA